MIPGKRTTLCVFLICFAAILPAGLYAEFQSQETQTATSQADQDTPPERQLGPFFSSGSIGLSTVFVDINGSRDKYRTDFNHLPGFNLSEFSLSLDSEEQGVAWLDYLKLRGTGFGDAYPYQEASLVFGKRARYEFRGNFRKQEYFFSMPSFALGGHGEDSARRMTDLTLRLFPHEKITVELGYFRNYNFGSSFSSATEFQRLFEIRDPRRSLTQDFRIGALVNHGPLVVTISQNFRKFKEDPESEDNRPLQPGSLPPSVQSSIPVRLSIPSTSFSARLSPSDRWEIAGRYFYSDGHVDASQSEFIALQIAEGISLDKIVKATSFSDRPEHRFELDGSVDLTDRIVFSHTFETERFEITGSLSRSTTLQGNNPGLPSLVQEDECDSFFKYTLMRARPQLEFRLLPGLSVHAGYQYGQRTLEENPSVGQEVTVSHIGFAGFSWRPYKDARLSLQFENGTANDAFTRIEPRDITRWRFTSYIPIVEGLSLSPHFVVSTRENETRSHSYEADQHQVGIEATYIVPGRRIILTSGYTLFDLDTLADIRFFTQDELTDGLSRYKTHLHFFHSRAAIPLGERVMLNFAYSFLLDPSSSSYPLRRDQGEAGVTWRMQTDWTWDLRWRHVSYNETLSSTQDYMANLLGLTLRWSF